MDEPVTGAPRGSTDPPKQVRIAARLWSVLGCSFAIAMIVPLSDPDRNDVPAFIPLFFIGYGITMVVLARRLRRGHDTRGGLALGGALLLIGLLPALLVIPALVLQWRRPSNAWFDARRRPPPPRPDGSV